MGTRILRSRTIAGLGLLLVAVATAAQTLAAGDFDEQADYVAAVEQAKGHLLASREVYRRGQSVRADVHASHPIQELGYRLWRPVTKVDPELGARVQAAFKEPGRAVEARVPSREYDRVVDRTLGLLDRAIERVAPGSMRADPRFQGQVMQAMLIAIDEEYEEAVAEGRVVLEIEYQDAWGFFQRLRALWEPLRRQLAGPAAATVATIDEHMALLAKAFSSIETPARPVAVDRVKAALDAIAAALKR
jgi:hypothetical protein